MAMLIENHKQTVLELMKDGEAFLQRIGDLERAGRISGYRADAEGREAPAILFYGLYNAGKSTLINALCRADVAKVGDVPTTEAIQRIDWEEYVLIDTPGINAQNAHDLTAKENIDRSDLVLFVVDNSDTFDNAIVYQAVFDILKTGKALAIVVNQKNVDEEEDANVAVPGLPSMMKVIDKISKNMAQQSARSGVALVERSNFLGCYAVNALDALEAREASSPERRSRREQISGILSLRTTINETLRRSMRVYRLQTPLINLNEVLRQAAEAYENTALYGEKQAMAEAREQLLTSRSRMRDTLISDGLRKIEASFERIRSGDSGQAGEENRLDEELNTLLKRVAEQEQAVLEQAFSIGALPEEELVPVSTGGEEDAELMDALATVVRAIPPIVVTVPTTPPVPVDLALLAKIAAALVETFRSKKRKEQEALEEARRSAEQTAAYYRWLGELRDYEDKVKAIWKKKVDDVVKQCYDAKLAQLDAELAGISADCAAHTQNLRELEQLRLRVSNEMLSLATAL